MTAHPETSPAPDHVSSGIGSDTYLDLGGPAVAALFSLLDADERQVLSQQVEERRFAAGETIFRTGDPGAHAYVVCSGKVHITSAGDNSGMAPLWYHADAAASP